MSNTPNLKYQRKRLLYASSLKNRERAGVINECTKPDLGASKADLAELHQEEMRSRRYSQLRRTPNVRDRQSGSLANNVHKGEREIARRARQTERRA